MRKAVLFTLVGFCAFILFSRIFLNVEMGEGYNYMSVLEDVFSVFTWIADKIKSIFDGMKAVGDWWSSLFGGVFS